MKNSQAHNQNGSALVIALILVASVMVTTVAVMQNTTTLSQVYAQKAQSQIADNVSQLISSVMSNEDVCLSGFDGTGAESGLQFLTSTNGIGTFNLAQASLPTGQNVSLPSNFPNGSGGRLRMQSGQPIPGSELAFNRVFVRNAVIDPDVANAYRMELVAQVWTSYGGETRGLNVRKIMDLRIIISGATVTACGPAPAADSNRKLCEDMNCAYSISASGDRSCFCPVQPMACTGGNYVVSFIDSVPQCSTTPMERCCTKPSEFLVGLDGTSQQICAAVVTCPAGSSTAGLGGPANPPACRCNTAGQTYSGGVCGTGVAAACGTASDVAVASAPSTNLCSVGSASAVTGGAGPWTWSCTDAFGGTPAACSANLSTTLVNGTCGIAIGTTHSIAPTTNLCGAGTPTAVADAGTAWTWTCNGANGGTPSGLCAADKAATTCIAGSSTTGAGPLVLTGPCKCNNATDTFNGMNCVAAGAGIPWVQLGGPGGATTTCTGSPIYSETAAGGIFARIVNDPVTGFESYQQVVPPGAACLLESTHMCCWGMVDSTRTFYTGPPANPSDPGLSRYEGSACRTAGQLIVGDFVVDCTVGSTGSNYDCCSNSWTCIPNGATPARRCN